MKTVFDEIKEIHEKLINGGEHGELEILYISDELKEAIINDPKLIGMENHQ